ncbi:hypothetical protein [Halomicrococcus sp. NG-SE-24]|uniref:hypothetical protein n=1 Tax=Halomicrococcus sp. NG-SE-24 TaxID=3436928 RepID=UPI003D9952B7
MSWESSPVRSITSAGDLIGPFDDPIHLILRRIVHVLAVLTASNRQHTVVANVLPE